eukprot:Nitzschia sp. Nitz4//scaffold476_size6971//665//3403//NITZ4_009164-RA/size6971-processed-gene-0.5-mRNA-1//1//CDS//3329552718//4753//frame0
MKDYAQYSSRIPSPSTKRFSPRNAKSPSASTPTKPSTASPGTKATTTTTTNGATTMTTTHNVAVHPLHSTPQRQQQAQSQEKRERDSTSTVSSNTTPRQSPSASTPTMTANDALSVRQKGSEATIVQLREALEDANNRDATAKAALAKSDAVILELRTSIRQLKRQLESKELDTQQASQQKQSQAEQQVQQLKSQIDNLQRQLNHQNTASSRDSQVGELQVQLDRAHAQIITADMVRKELEDTLEAEQYTWELRVQDQERQIAELNEECNRLQADLQEARNQWKEAEHGWNEQIEELQQQLTQARTRIATTQAATVSGLAKAAGDESSTTNTLLQKIQQLETERAELQNCLDEALQELEAVDVELQSEGKAPKSTPSDVIESLQHLLRWIHQESPSSAPSRSKPSLYNTTRDPKKIVTEIRDALEGWLQDIPSPTKGGAGAALAPARSVISTGDATHVSHLESQVQQYQDELKSREESSAELRESLKEAVALLKPLQDAVAKAESDKQHLQEQLVASQQATQTAQHKLTQSQQQVKSLESEVSHLEQQVKEQTSIATARASLLASPTPTTPGKKANDNDDSLSKIQRAREELRRKRETEGNLQQLLKDAQTRFHSLHQQNEDVAARNRELQGKLNEAETQMISPTASPQDQLEHAQRQLKDKEAQVEQLQLALKSGGQDKIQELDRELETTRQELAAKEQTEVVLNKSLKDALGLLKPLQMHLEEAEKEKLEISKELRNLRKRFRQLQMGDNHHDDQSRSTYGGGQDVSVELVKIRDELEETVRQLELENSQLHDALEDMSQNGSSEAKLRQKLVEMNSKYEVAQNKLEDAHVENHALVRSLRQKELEEQQQSEELEALRKQLAKSESELQNAKAIARSALVKVEELTMSNIEQLSLSRDGSLEMQFPVSGH